ncbi:unnamed protein product [Sphagnum troendelagicum]
MVRDKRPDGQSRFVTVHKLVDWFLDEERIPAVPFVEDMQGCGRLQKKVVDYLFKNHSDDHRLFGPKEERWDVKTSYRSGGIDIPRFISGDALYDINQQCSIFCYVESICRMSQSGDTDHGL